MQQRTRETFCKAYHFDRTQWNYKCRAYTRKICTLYGIYFKRIAAIPNRFSGDLQDIWTSNIFQRWNRKFFFRDEKTMTFLDFSYQYFFKDYLHVLWQRYSSCCNVNRDICLYQNTIADNSREHRTISKSIFFLRVLIIFISSFIIWLARFLRKKLTCVIHKRGSCTSVLEISNIN